MEGSSGSDFERMQNINQAINRFKELRLKTKAIRSEIRSVNNKIKKWSI